MEKWQLQQLQGLPLEVKIEKTKLRIKEWYEHWEGNVYVSFSGGKDSTVLLHLVREIYPNVQAVFADTGLEYPEIRDFVKSVDNIEWLKPSMQFKDTITKHGYPIIGKEVSQAIYEARRKPDGVQALKFKTGNKHSEKYGARYDLNKYEYLLESNIKISHLCCNEMKKKPFKNYEKRTGFVPIVGTMTEESKLRENSWMKTGCNSFEGKRPMSTPISFWVEKDIWDYIKMFNVPYSKIYDMGYKRTGCMFCMFGINSDGYPNRFQRMQKTHPKQYEYCMNNLGLKEVLEFINIPYEDNQISMFE